MKYFLIFLLIFISGSVFGTQNPLAEEWQEFSALGTFGSGKLTVERLFKIPISIENQTVSKIDTIKFQQFDIFLSEVKSDSSLTIKIPRFFPFSQFQEEHYRKDFFVIVNGEETKTEKKLIDCYLEIKILVPKNTEKISLVWSGVASNHPYLGEPVSQKCLEKTIDHSLFNAKFPSPREQQKNNLPNIFCGEALQLVYKISGSAACVNPSSIQKLIERDWAKDNSLTTQQVSESNECLALYKDIKTHQGTPELQMAGREAWEKLNQKVLNYYKLGCEGDKQLDFLRKQAECFPPNECQIISFEGKEYKLEGAAMRKYKNFTNYEMEFQQLKIRFPYLEKNQTLFFGASGDKSFVTEITNNFLFNIIKDERPSSNPNYLSVYGFMNFSSYSDFLNAYKMEDFSKRPVQAGLVEGLTSNDLEIRHEHKYNPNWEEGGKLVKQFEKEKILEILENYDRVSIFN